MVRVSIVRYAGRIPVIKFRKGGMAQAGQGGQAAQSSAAPAGQTVSISTGTVLNEVPTRYQRLPLSQEEIDHINGGGIRDDDPVKRQPTKEDQCGVAIIRLPQGVLKSKQISVNIVVQKNEKKK